MSTQLNKEEMSAVIKETVSRTISHNDKQDYYEDDKSYATMFVEDREKILKSAKVDSAKVGDWEMDCVLGAKQIIDLIKTDPDLSALKKAYEAKDISVDGFGMNYPVVYIDHKNFVNDNKNNNVMSVEPNDGSLIGNGYQVTLRKSDDDVYASNLKEGLKNVQSTLLSVAPEYREKASIKIKPKM